MRMTLKANHIINMCVLLAFTSCSRTEQLPVQPAANVPLIQSVLFTNSNGSTDARRFVYLNQKKDSVLYSGGAYEVYRYATDSVIAKLYDGAGQFTATYRFGLNSNGLVKTYVTENASGAVTASYTYTFNSDGLPVKVTRSVSPLNETRYFYTGLRPDSIHTISNGLISVREVVEQVDSTINNTLGPANLGMPWQGASSMAVLTSKKYFHLPNGALLNTIPVSNSYTINGLSQITKLVTVSGAGSSIQTFTQIFSYY